MNNKQFQDALSFARTDDPSRDHVSVRATFRMYREALVSREAIQFSSHGLDILGKVSAQLAREITHDIYEDRVRELYKAATEVYNSSPYDGFEAFQARRDFLSLATRQPYADIQKIMEQVNVAEENKKLRDRIKKLEKHIEILCPTKPIFDFGLGD